MQHKTHRNQHKNIQGQHMSLAITIDTTPAEAAHKMVHSLRVPKSGENISTQYYEAAKQIGMHRSDADLERFRKAWYGAAGPTIFFEIFKRINARLDRSVEFWAGQAIEAMNEADSEFYANHVEALRGVVSPTYGMGGKEGE